MCVRWFSIIFIERFLSLSRSIYLSIHIHVMNSCALSCLYFILAFRFVKIEEYRFICLRHTHIHQVFCFCISLLLLPSSSYKRRCFHSRTIISLYSVCKCVCISCNLLLFSVHSWCFSILILVWYFFSKFQFCRSVASLSLQFTRTQHNILTVLLYFLVFPL